MIDKEPRIGSAQESKAMTREELADAVRGFTPDETVIDITLTNGKGKGKGKGNMLFKSYDPKKGVLHYAGVGGKWPTAAETSYDLIADVREHQAQ